MTVKNTLLSVKGLSTWVGHEAKPIRPVDSVDFDIQRGETFALLGESGCGKSMTALSLLRLNPTPISRIVAGQVFLDDQNLMALSEAQMERVRGRRVAMIFQEPQSSLNPVLTVGQQIGESLRLYFGMGQKQIEQRTLELLNSVGIPAPEQRINEYPHQLSGGMKQRVMIAIALAGDPELLIADEPTTALDVTIQAQILELLKTIQQKTGMAILLISHDLAVVAQMADHVAVMYAGQIVEKASKQHFFEQTKHPYSKKLFEALPTAQKREQRLTVIKGHVPALDQGFTACRFADRCDFAFEPCHDTRPRWLAQDGHGIRCHLYDPDITGHNERAVEATTISPLSEIPTSNKAVLSLQQLKVHFPIRRGLLQRVVGHVRAVDGVDLLLHQAETLALVGESGCGKTTVGKAILQLVDITDGTVNYREHVLNKLPERQLKQHRNALQIIFQDPYSSMNPRMTVGQILQEAMISKALINDKAAKAKRVDELLERVGLRPEFKSRYPHEFSGGQRQRICIARALAAEPELIICDEPTSALDVSVQAQILNLLREIQHEFGLSYLFITHNIAVVDYLAQRIAVMYLGRIVEQGSRDDVLNSPKHPYTQALLAAVPKIEDNKQTQATRLKGELPSPANPPKGCHFHQRCPHVMAKCTELYPDATNISDSHQVRCFLYQQESE